MARCVLLFGVVDLHLGHVLGAMKVKTGDQVGHSFLLFLNLCKTQYLPYSYDALLNFSKETKVLMYNCLASLIILLMHVSNKTSGARLWLMKYWCVTHRPGNPIGPLHIASSRNPFSFVYSPQIPLRVLSNQS